MKYEFPSVKAVLSEEERIFDEKNPAAFLKGRMLGEQLVRVNYGGFLAHESMDVRNSQPLRS